MLHVVCMCDIHVVVLYYLHCIPFRHCIFIILHRSSNCTLHCVMCQLLVRRLYIVSFCFHKSLQPLLDVVPSNGAVVNSSEAVAAAEHLQQVYLTRPNCHELLLMRQSSKDENRTGDGIRLLHQTADMDHIEIQQKEHGTEQFENVARVKSDEANTPTLSHKQDLQSSLTQRPDTPLPLSAAIPAAGIMSEEKQQEFVSMEQPRHPVLPHLKHHIPRTVEESVCKRAETDHKSFHYLVYLLVY